MAHYDCWWEVGEVFMEFAGWSLMSGMRSSAVRSVNSHRIWTRHGEPRPDGQVMLKKLRENEQICLGGT